MSRPAITTIAVCAGVLTTACSGGGTDRSSDHEAIERTVRRWLTAVAEGDTATACSLLTSAAKSELRDGVLDASARDDEEVCRDAVAQTALFLTPEMRKAVRLVRVAKVKVSGDLARLAENDIVFEPRYAYLKEPSNGVSTLRRTREGWKIEGMI